MSIYRDDVVNVNLINSVGGFVKVSVVLKNTDKKYSDEPVNEVFGYLLKDGTITNKIADESLDYVKLISDQIPEVFGSGDIVNDLIAALTTYGYFLEDYGINDVIKFDRVISIVLSDDKDKVIMTEECDQYFDVELDKDAMTKFIDDLTKIRDQMV